jgi:hypothetical protein
MAIFDDVVVNAKTAAQAVSKKAGEVVELSKLRISLSGLRSDLNKQFLALGEAVYNNESEEEIAQIRSAIDETKLNIDEVEAILASVRNTVVCVNCGEKLQKNAQYCYICGTPVPTEKKVCPECGEEIAGSGKFCSNCGKAVE